jgi:hypothetical protein
MSIEANRILETFKSSVVSNIYDAIDNTTRQAVERMTRAEELQVEVYAIKSEIAELRRRLGRSPLLEASDQPSAALSSEQHQRADILDKCLTMCSRMTACQVDVGNGGNGLVCGTVSIKRGDMFDRLQANWDLIDTVTGADA